MSLDLRSCIPIALQNGLPYDLADRLQGTDEESLRADAERLASFVKSTEYVAPMRNLEPALEKNENTSYKNLVQGLVFEE